MTKHSKNITREIKPYLIEAEKQIVIPAKDKIMPINFEIAFPIIGIFLKVPKMEDVIEKL